VSVCRVSVCFVVSLCRCLRLCLFPSRSSSLSACLSFSVSLSHSPPTHPHTPCAFLSPPPPSPPSLPARLRKDTHRSWWRLEALRRYLSPGCALFATLYWWSAPLVWFPSTWFWPLSWILNKPGFPLGAISAASWTFMSLRATNSVIKTLNLFGSNDESG
jgi:hypothetical protein